MSSWNDQVRECCYHLGMWAWSYRSHSVPGDLINPAWELRSEQMWGFHPPWIPISGCITRWSEYLLLLRWWNLWNQGMYVDNAYICMHVFMCIHKYVQWYVYNVWIIMYIYILLYDSMQCPYCHRDKSISGAAEDPTFCLQVLPDGEDNNYATIILTIIRYVIQM